jgi:hypothetical protein
VLKEGKSRQLYMLTFVGSLMTTLMFSTDPWLVTCLHLGPKSS